MSKWTGPKRADELPMKDRGQTDATGRIAKWLDEAREMGYRSRDIARMLGEVYVGPAPGRAAGSVEELADLLDEMALDEGDSA